MIMNLHMIKRCLCGAAIVLSAAVMTSGVEANPQKLASTPEIGIQARDKNVVSVVLSLDENATPQAVKERIGQYLKNNDDPGLKVRELEDEILVSRVIPDWHQRKVPSELSIYLDIVKLFAQKNAQVNDNGAIIENPLDSTTIINVFSAPYEDAPEALLEARRKKIADMLAEEGKQVQILVTPELYFYGSKTGYFLGSAKFAERKPFFEKAQDHQNNIPTLNWLVPPTLIQPKIDITAQESSRPIELNPKISIWRLPDLMSFLKQQGIKFVGLDQRLRTSRVYIEQNRKWTVGDLLRSVCSVSGCEVKKIGDKYFLGVSQAHLVVANNAADLINAKQDQAEMLKLLTQIFLLNGKKIDLPFDQKYFFAASPLNLESISEVDRQDLIAIADKDVKSKVGKVWFVLSLSMRLKTPTRGSTLGVLLTPFPPDAALNPPENWTAYSPSDFLKSYGAKIVQ